MERGSSRTLAIVVLTVISIALVGVGIFVAIQLQNNDVAPVDTSAFGFGEETITTFFDDVDEFFKNVECDDLLDDGLVYSLSNIDGEGDPLEGYALSTLYEQNAVGYWSKRCVYTEDGLVLDGVNFFTDFIELEMKTYGPDPIIYDSQSSKIAILNEQLIGTEIFSGSFDDVLVDYTYGTAATTDETCRIVLYHQYNEYEYMNIDLEGYNCNLPYTQRIAKLFAWATGSYIHESIILIYDEYHFDPNNVTIVQ